VNFIRASPGIGPPGEPTPRCGELWLGATVDLEAILATSETVQLSVGNFLAFPDGWAFDFRVTRDPFTQRDMADSMPPGFPPMPGMSAREGRLEFGLRFSDGRRALPMGSDGTLQQRNGGGSMGQVVHGYLVTRAPTAEDVTFVFRYPAEGIGQGEYVLDGSLLAAAAQQCVPLWQPA
jgi:hypothetical protein